MDACPARSCASTRTPTTKRSSRAARSRAPRARVTASSSCSRRAVSSARSSTACSRRRRRSVTAASTRRERAAEVLGVARVVFLGYHDSGMAGEDTNDADARVRGRRRRGRRPSSSRRSCREEEAEVFTAYDERGGYGHPDHVKVHDVGVRAAALAGTPAPLRRDREPAALRAAHRASASPSSRADVDAPEPTTSSSASTRRASPPSSTCATSSTRSGPRWPRTRARSARRRSSWRSPTTRFAETLRHRVVHPPRRASPPHPRTWLF